MELKQDPMKTARDKVLAQYEPAGNVHTPMMDNHYISCSQLVSRTAEEMATLILREAGLIDGEMDDVPSYWSYKGNALGDRALEDVAHKEINFRVPIASTNWTLSGNCDGVEDIDGHVFVYEHKAYGHPTAKKIEVAKRQGILYLAMAWWNHIHRNGNADGIDSAGDMPTPKADTIFSPAAYAEGETAFTWPKESVPGGVLVCVAPNFPPAQIHEYDVSPEECEEVLAYYIAKAKAIINAVQSGDPALARDTWDRKDPGSMEFVRDLEDFNEPIPDDFDALAGTYAKLNAEVKEKQGELDDAKGLLIAAMDKHGIKKTESENYRISMVEIADKVVPEHVVPEKTKKGYRYLKVQGNEP